MLTRVFYTSASAKFPADKFASSGKDGQSSTTEEQKKIVLNSGEELYAELRDKNFNAVGPVLSRKTKLLTAEFDVSSTMHRPI